MILLALLTLAPAGLYAQNRRILGRVVGTDGNPIIGATVVARESKRATATDVQGLFTLNVLPEDKTLDVTYIGMQSQAVAIASSKTVYNITMQEELTDLDQVVVIGYGSAQKSDIAGAITSLTAKDIEQNSGADLNAALAGQIPGMNIVSTSGEPAAGANIAIRGVSSISGDSQPLYIVDGVPIDSDNIAAIDDDATFSPIASLDPNDIESVEVLRDAASASIYGSRAANGVVLITTKGAKGLGELRAPTVNFSHTSTIASNIRKLDVLNATQYRELYVESRRNNNGASATQGWVLNPFSPLYYRSTDWQDVLFRDNVYNTVNNLSIRGSSKEFSYSLSLGYRDLSPTSEYTQYKQYNGRANFTYKLSKAIEASTSLSYTMSRYRRILTSPSTLNNVVTTALNTNPAYSPYDYETGELLMIMGANETRNPLAFAKMVP